MTVVSKILGHGSISTTLNIYAHTLAEHMEQFERQRARILGGVGHLTRLRLHKNGKARSIYDAGWSSLVARRAHNPEVVGSNPTPATSNPNDSQGLLIRRESGALFDLQLSRQNSQLFVWLLLPVELLQRFVPIQNACTHRA